MAKQIIISHEDDFKFLKNYVDQWQARAHSNISGYSEYIDRFDRLAADFGEAKTLTNPSEQVAVPAASVEYPAEKKKRGSVSEPLQTYTYCPEHPHYGAKRSPRTDCEACWAAYHSLNPLRAKQAKAKFDRKQRNEHG